MDPRRQCTCEKSSADAGDDSAGDRITALPLELRARMASLLPHWQRPALGALPGVAPHPPPHARRQDRPLQFLHR
nr:unnamed protein product [Digitaria exilis]